VLKSSKTETSRLPHQYGNEYRVVRSRFCLPLTAADSKSVAPILPAIEGKPTIQSAHRGVCTASMSWEVF
jgi:hypothetical protein